MRKSRAAQIKSSLLWKWVESSAAILCRFLLTYFTALDSEPDRTSNCLSSWELHPPPMLVGGPSLDVMLARRKYHYYRSWPWSCFASLAALVVFAPFPQPKRNSISSFPASGNIMARPPPGSLYPARAGMYPGCPIQFSKIRW